MSDAKTKLSASRIKTAQSCSWLYHCKYKLKLPDTSNDGASRGTVCHNILELLAKKGRYRYYQQIVKARDVFVIPSIRRLILLYARSLDVGDEENLELIKSMTLRGILYDFHGKSLGKPTHSFSEKHFQIDVNDGDKKYRINGFIDKLFLYNDSNIAVVRDFKTSKQVFKGKDRTDNLQDLMYSLAVKHLYPKYCNRRTEFLFLKFDLEVDLLGDPGPGVLSMVPLSDAELEGFEYQLSAIQAYLDKFNEDTAVSNFAGSQNYPSDGSFGGPLMCGKDGPKMRKGRPLLDNNGNEIPAYICAFRKPFEYYALCGSDGNLKKTAFLIDKASLLAIKEEGDTIEQRAYSGCPYWNKESVVDEFTL